MADEVKAVFLLLLENPEKAALLLVVITGAWRWIRELFREHKEDTQHDVFMELLLKEDKDLRAENARLHTENARLQRQIQRVTDAEE